LEQARINDTIVKKLASNDKILEDINTKMDDFSSAIKDQLDHNKKVETQLSWLAASFTTNNEQVKGITTRHGKTTKYPPYLEGA
jgi:predicted RNA-binding protein Jag